jgi:hypothetical protein
VPARLPVRQNPRARGVCKYRVVLAPLGMHTKNV